MGKTKIEWADFTFNPWTGCTPVSEACDHCYAEAWAKRTGRPELWKGERRRTSEAYWKQPLKWNEQAMFREVDEPRPRVFCASLADVFDNQVPSEWRHDLWELIARTPHLDWLLLTKRPQNIAKMLPGGPLSAHLPWPWSSVWLGATVENQEQAKLRIPHLLRIPAAKRFLSCEPLLGPLDLVDIIEGHWPDPCDETRHVNALTGGITLTSPKYNRVRQQFAPVDLVICGGESGPQARPMRLSWVRSIIGQCRAAGVPCFVKQMGRTVIDDISYVEISHDLKFADAKGGDMGDWPNEFRIREMPHV